MQGKAACSRSLWSSLSPDRAHSGSFTAVDLPFLVVEKMSLHLPLVLVEMESVLYFSHDWQLCTYYIVCEEKRY